MVHSGVGKHGQYDIGEYAERVVNLSMMMDEMGFKPGTYREEPLEDEFNDFKTIIEERTSPEYKGLESSEFHRIDQEGEPSIFVGPAITNLAKIYDPEEDAYRGDADVEPAVIAHDENGWGIQGMNIRTDDFYQEVGDYRKRVYETDKLRVEMPTAINKEMKISIKQSYYDKSAESLEDVPTEDDQDDIQDYEKLILRETQKDNEFEEIAESLEIPGHISVRGTPSLTISLEEADNEAIEDVFFEFAKITGETEVLDYILEES